VILPQEPLVALPNLLHGGSGVEFQHSVFRLQGVPPFSATSGSARGARTLPEIRIELLPSRGEVRIKRRSIIRHKGAKQASKTIKHVHFEYTENSSTEKAS
jgi:hypothetical protein